MPSELALSTRSGSSTSVRTGASGGQPPPLAVRAKVPPTPPTPTPLPPTLPVLADKGGISFGLAGGRVSAGPASPCAAAAPPLAAAPDCATCGESAPSGTSVRDSSASSACPLPAPPKEKLSPTPTLPPLPP
eukprot:363933-Chlamydomonas_euryale.AAC.2